MGEQKELKKIEDEKRKHTIMQDEYAHIINITKDAVRNNLKAPSTAKFQGGYLIL